MKGTTNPEEITMPAIKYRGTLTEEEVEMLESLLRKGKSAACKQTRARILLKAAAGCKDAEIMEALAVSAPMVGHTRQRCVEEGVEVALEDRPRPGKAAKLTDQQCAHRIATVCTPAPAGHEHWTLRLLAERGVPLGDAESFSYETMRRLLKKHFEALAGAGVVHSGGRRGVCRAHGGRARPVCRALRSGASGTVL
jgi:transposase